MVAARVRQSGRPERGARRMCIGSPRGGLRVACGSGGRRDQRGCGQQARLPRRARQRHRSGRELHGHAGRGRPDPGGPHAGGPGERDRAFLQRRRRSRRTRLRRPRGPRHGDQVLSPRRREDRHRGPEPSVLLRAHARGLRGVHAHARARARDRRAGHAEGRRLPRGAPGGAARDPVRARGQAAGELRDGRLQQHPLVRVGERRRRAALRALPLGARGRRAGPRAGRGQGAGRGLPPEGDRRARARRRGLPPLPWCSPRRATRWTIPPSRGPRSARRWRLAASS